MRTSGEIAQYIQDRIDTLSADKETTEDNYMFNQLHGRLVELQWLQEFLKGGDQPY